MELINQLYIVYQTIKEKIQNLNATHLKEGERVRETEQGVRGAAQVVGDRVPRQATRLRTTRRGTLLHRTLDDVIDIRGEFQAGALYV